MAWHNGKWLFAGETLAEVIDEVSRYTDRRIEITDPQIAKLRIGGYFDIGEIDALMDALQAGFGVEVKQVSTQLIQLSALDSGKAQ
jgi:transmembrane sensor